MPVSTLERPVSDLLSMPETESKLVIPPVEPWRQERIKDFAAVANTIVAAQTHFAAEGAPSEKEWCFLRTANCPTLSVTRKGELQLAAKKQVLTIRPVVPGDLDPMRKFYDGMDKDSNSTRWFCSGVHAASAGICASSLVEVAEANRKVLSQKGLDIGYAFEQANPRSMTDVVAVNERGEIAATAAAYVENSRRALIAESELCVSVGNEFRGNKLAQLTMFAASLMALKGGEKDDGGQAVKAFTAETLPANPHARQALDGVMRVLAGMRFVDPLESGQTSYSSYSADSGCFEMVAPVSANAPRIV